MRTLNRFIRYLLPIGILLAVVVFSPGPGATRAGQAAHDFAHAPVFAGITLLLLVLLAKRDGRSLPAWSQYSLAVGLACVFGVATEIVQKWSGGDASWLDVRSDAIGSLVACGIFAAFDQRIGRPLGRIVVAAAALALLTWHSLPFARVGLSYLHRNEEFPTLFDARDPRADRFMVATDAQLRYGTLPPELGGENREPALHVRLHSAQWPGIAFEEPYPDWSQHRRLMIELANPEDQALELTVRVLDAAHDWSFEDRFNRTLLIEPHTRKQYAIAIAEIEEAPAARRLDTKQIADLRFFARGLSGERSFFLIRVWLE